MPIDAMGNFRHNHEAAKMHSEAAGKKYNPEGGGEEDGEHTKVFNHGDGTFHTEHNGERVDHESIGHMHAHLSKIHGEDGHQHFHAHHDGMEGHSHHVSGDGEPDHQEHDMANLEGLKEHFGKFIDEEAKEPAEGEGDEEESEAGGKGLGGLY